MTPAVSAILPWIVWPDDAERSIQGVLGRFNAMIYDDRHPNAAVELMSAQGYVPAQGLEVQHFAGVEPAHSVYPLMKVFWAESPESERAHLQWFLLKRVSDRQAGA